MQAPPPYTPSEFHRSVLATHPRTAVFDCDGTLWPSDSGHGFLLWSLDHHIVPARSAAWITERYRLYLAGQVDEAAICGEMVQLYSGLREPDIEQAAQAYIEAHIAPTVFPEMAALIAGLHQQGAELWAVSSTSRWVIEAAVTPLFQIPRQRILAVEVAVQNGIITDTLLSVPTDEAKAEALQLAGLPHPDCVFGNSIHDAAMLEIAQHPFPVNPNASLAPRAAERSWRCFYPEL